MAGACAPSQRADAGLQCSGPGGLPAGLGAGHGASPRRHCGDGSPTHGGTASSTAAWRPSGLPLAALCLCASLLACARRGWRAATWWPCVWHLTPGAVVVCCHPSHGAGAGACRHPQGRGRGPHERPVHDPEDQGGCHHPRHGQGVWARTGATGTPGARLPSLCSRARPACACCVQSSARQHSCGCLPADADPLSRVAGAHRASAWTSSTSRRSSPPPTSCTTSTSTTSRSPSCAAAATWGRPCAASLRCARAAPVCLWPPPSHPPAVLLLTHVFLCPGRGHDPH